MFLKNPLPSFRRIAGHCLSSLRHTAGETLRNIDEAIGIEIFKLSIVFSTVYFVQGMGGLSNIPVFFYFKDVIKFSPSQLQYFGSISGLAWFIKPLFGFISDRFPIAGYRRKSYMILMALTAASSWWLLAWLVQHRLDNYAALVLVFNISALGYAFVDVVCDGLMVQKGQALNKEEIFVNIQWFALGIASFISGVYSGKLQTAIKAGTISLPFVFIIVGCIPLLTSFIGWLFISEEKITAAAKKNAAEAATPPTAPQEKLDCAIFKEIVTSKVFWVLSAFIFFWNFTPSFGAVFQYYEVDIMKFDGEFLGILSAIGGAIFPLSIIFYGNTRKWFTRIKTKHYLYANIVIALVGAVLFWLYLIPENSLAALNFFLSPNDLVIIFGYLPAVALLAVFSFSVPMYFRLEEYRQRRLAKGMELKQKNIRRIQKLDKKIRNFGKIRLIVGWLTVTIPFSLLFSLWFGGFNFSPFVLNYRNLTIAKSVIFDYIGIASFLIPLALAAQLAPKKAEGMVYAYFMALSNLSKGLLPSVSGAWMYDVLMEMLNEPGKFIKPSLAPLLQIIQNPPYTILLIFLFIFSVGTWFMFRDKEMRLKDALLAEGIFLSIGIVFCGYAVWEILRNSAVYLTQQSYLLVSQFLGNADFLENAKDANHNMILRYSIWLSALFIIISTYFVYILKIPKHK